MKAILKSKSGSEFHEILIQNIEHSPEYPVFETIGKAFNVKGDILVRENIAGPSEDIIIAECLGDEVRVIYDIDYGLMPIQCTARNADRILDVVNEVLNN